jgi:spore maturation protein CgeB
VRVLVVDTYYRAFWQSHYAHRPRLAHGRYDAQLSSLIDRRFGTSDAYSHHLVQLGHEAREVVCNCVPLQAAWAREHGIAGVSRMAAGLPRRAQWAARPLLERTLLAQIEEFDPDVVYLQDLAALWPPVRRKLRKQRRLLVAQIASTAPPDAVLRDCDLVITSFPHWVDRLRARGICSEYVPLAFDERILREVNAEGERAFPVTFVGTLNPADYGGGAQRVLERACAELDVSVFGVGAERLPDASAIRRDYRGEAWGSDMYRVLAMSCLTLNRHNDVAEGHANNMRLFEATGMGAVLVTEAAPNLAQLFTPGQEVVAYSDADDLVTKVSRLLDDDSERRRIAQAGQRRTLADHTYEKRMPRLVELIEARSAVRR